MSDQRIESRDHPRGVTPLTPGVEESRAVRAVRRHRRIHGFGWTLGRWLVRLIAIAAFVFGLASLVGWVTFSSTVVGLALIVAGLALGALVVDFYLTQHWAALPHLSALTTELVESGQANLADYVTWEAAELLSENRSQPPPGRGPAAAGKTGDRNAVTSLHSLLNAAGRTEAFWIIRRLGLEPPEEVTGGGGVPVAELLQRAAGLAVEQQRPLVDDGDLLSAVFQLDPAGAMLLKSAGLTGDDVAAVSAWLRRIRLALVHRPLWAEPPGPGIAADWTSGYTPFVRQFVDDLTEEARSVYAHVSIHGRDAEIERLATSLAQTRGHNLVLIGPVGSGRMGVIHGLADRIAAGTAPAPLRDAHLLALDVGAVLAGVSDRGEIEARLLRIFSEVARAGNVILVIPDLHLLIGGSQDVGGVDATSVVAQALAAPAVRIIATTTPEEFQARLSAQSSILSQLERLDLPLLASSAVVAILEDAVLAAEAEAGVWVTYPALVAIAEVAERYVPDQAPPTSALNLLTDVVTVAGTAKEPIVTPEFVRAQLSQKLELPLLTAQGEERDRLTHLEDDLHQTVVDQEEAIGAIANALRRARSGVASTNRPIASFLFLGPTGVGKTETAKALARVYFQAHDRLVNLDMTQFSQADALPRLVGGAAAGGTKTPGLLTDAVHDQPFCLLLLDEFEKADREVHNLFLRVLDEGTLTDGTGRMIDFTNTLIIATSNAGAELIRESIAAGEDQETRRAKLLEYLQKEKLYSPELLNRFDGVIAFRTLEPAHVAAIVRLLLGELATKLQTEQQITLTWDEGLVTALATTGFDPQFGARPIRRLIADKVETSLANQLLTGALKKDESIALTAASVGLLSVQK